MRLDTDAGVDALITVGLACIILACVLTETVAGMFAVAGVGLFALSIPEQVRDVRGV